jgi:protein-S-isoprenylcysteine O-methyltransferase Ste14
VYVVAYLIGAGMEHYIPSGAKTLRGITVAGVVVFLIGAVIAAWGLLLFYRQRTTTTPGEVSKLLVTWGPYRFTRNPMYVGLTLAYIGEAGILKQAWPLALLPFVLLYIQFIVVPLEEKRLSTAFPREYPQYCRSVRRWL